MVWTFRPHLLHRPTRSRRTPENPHGPSRWRCRQLDLGNLQGKSGEEILKALGDKLGLKPADISAESIQSVTRSATDHNRLMGLVNTIE
ncbi:MAG: hypothetical protein M3Y59_04300 [Myxococcota bacterium]|nr:hypothetical protein [Myxococcota bacterium]